MHAKAEAGFAMEVCKTHDDLEMQTREYDELKAMVGELEK